MTNKILFSIITLLSVFNSSSSAKEIFLYVGTYTNGESKGIYLYKMNTDDGKLEYVNVTEGVINPSFLALDKTGNYLYAVNELEEYEGKKTGTIAAFKIDPESKTLSFLNTVPTEGGAPCHLIVDASNKFVLAANYVGGNVCVVERLKDGNLGSRTGFVQHEGASVNIKRQAAPHAHSVNMDLQNKRAYAADLGIDKIMIYNLDPDSGSLTPNEISFTDVDAGAGPRHFTFHPSADFAYVINELNSTVTAFNYDKVSGALNKIESVSTLPSDFSGESYCADIHIHPNGKFLYGSNRGHNSIAVFGIDESTGKLNSLGYQSTKGNWPRNFTIDPTGNFLLVANQKSNDVFVFKINNQTGMLEDTGFSASIPSPVCLMFLSKN